MVICKTAGAFNSFLQKSAGNSPNTGYVPTMGALHQGHISLLNRARNSCDRVICSIFVNPTQFNDKSDYEHYPVTIERDIALLEENGCDLLFYPPVSEIYPGGTVSLPHYELGRLEEVFEGKYRPGHFQGVCQVVHRLLELVKPDQLFLGQKDYQQCMVIKRLLEITGKSDKISIQICPTLREESGLAMSSRNMRLTAAEQQQAAILYQTLREVQRTIQAGNLQDLLDRARAGISGTGLIPDYFEIADAVTLERLQSWDGKTRIIALVAAFLNKVRLIDNLIIN